MDKIKIKNKNNYNNTFKQMDIIFVQTKLKKIVIKLEGRKSKGIDRHSFAPTTYKGPPCE